jgi:polyphosphate kinase
MVTYAEKPAQPLPEPGETRYLNREISYLQYVERILQVAEDPSVPLLERAKFLAIVASNLDEFYMVRVAGLKRQQAAGLNAVAADGPPPASNSPTSAN